MVFIINIGEALTVGPSTAVEKHHKADRLSSVYTQILVVDNILAAPQNTLNALFQVRCSFLVVYFSFNYSV